MKVTDFTFLEKERTFSYLKRLIHCSRLMLTTRKSVLGAVFIISLGILIEQGLIIKQVYIVFPISPVGLVLGLDGSENDSFTASRQSSFDKITDVFLQLKKTRGTLANTLYILCKRAAITTVIGRYYSSYWHLF